MLNPPSGDPIDEPAAIVLASQVTALDPGAKRAEIQAVLAERCRRFGATGAHLGRRVELKQAGDLPSKQAAMAARSSIDRPPSKSSRRSSRVARTPPVLTADRAEHIGPHVLQQCAGTCAQDT